MQRGGWHLEFDLGTNSAGLLIKRKLLMKIASARTKERKLGWLRRTETPTQIYRKWSVMNSVQIEQKSYEMPPREGISIAFFLTVADIERSARYYEKVFDARILSLGEGGAPAFLQLANIWMILNVGGGPTPDKPTVTLSVPDPNHINSFMNFRVADIQACYELWKSRGAEFITEPIPKARETRCYIRDPDGYIIEVGQST
jgi:catechol 2,3-dioxygenase-like lactoylglutathione lyase family enzyme